MANWPNDKHIICNVNNDIPVKILSHPYVLVNRSVLCNCGREADSHHLLESLATCDNKQSKLIMYFTINLAFSNYLDLMPNMTELQTLNRDKTLKEQPLQVYLNVSHYATSLSNRPSKLKEFIHNYIRTSNDKDIFELQKRHKRYTFPPNKNFFLNKIVNIFKFTSSIISIITITLVIYLFCKHKHIYHYIPIKLCKTSGSLHSFKVTGTLTPEDIKLNRNYLWDTLEINWDKIKLAFNSNEIKLPKIITIKMQDKISVRRMMSRKTQNFHIMVKPGNDMVQSGNSISSGTFFLYFRWHGYSSQSAISCMGI